MNARKLDLRPFAVPLALVLLWEALMLAFPTASETLAPPHAVIIGFFGIVIDGTLALQTAQTLSSALGGLAIGFTLGSLMGVAFGLWRWFDRAMQISVESVRLIPSVALIPLSMMVFGFGTRMEMTIVAFTTQWPAMVLARAAVREVEPRLMEVATALRMSLFQTATKIVLPSILPRLFVSLRLTAGVAMIVAITVEVAANPYGLGAAILAAQISFRPEVMLATLIWTGVVGAGINQVLLTTQNRLFRHSLPGGGRSE